MTSRSEQYIRSLVGDFISTHTAEKALEIVGALCSSLSSLGEPTIAPAPDGWLGFTWNSPQHHFNLEIRAGYDRIVEVELFRENLQTHETWSKESKGVGITPEFVRELFAT